MSLSEYIYTVVLKPKPLKYLANAFLKWIVPKTIHVEGAVIHLNPNDPVVSGALTFRVFENDEIRFFLGAFTSDMTLLDVGANVGLYSGLALSRPMFSGKVIAMEPHPECFNYLERTVSENSRTANNCILSQKAASDVIGEALLFANPENMGDNRLYEDVLLVDKTSVQTTTIDDLCADNNVQTIDFIKIDIQGAEEKAITGGKKVLECSDNCILLSEVWPYGLERCGASLQSYVSLLQSLGFSLYRLRKHAALEPLDIELLLRECKGRQYANIVGLKGKYKKEGGGSLP